MRDLVVLLLVYASLPGIVFFPFYGLLVYSWLAYMRPQDLAWSLQGTSLSLYVAVLLLAGLAISVLRGKEKFMILRAETVLLVILVSWLALSSHFARASDLAWHYWSMLAKGVLIALITTGLVTTRFRLQLMVGVIAMSLGAIGFKYALFGLLRGGVRYSSGPGGFMVDNNGLAAALVMAIPLLAGVSSSAEQRWLRILANVFMVCCAISIVFTFSRGGLLGLVVVGFLLLLRSKRRLLAATSLGLGLVAVVFLTSEGFQQSYLQRTETISSYEEDSSALGRLDAWKTAVEVAADNPILGVGLGGLPLVYGEYSHWKARVAHNSFFQLLAETGYAGAFLWVLILVISLLRLQRICAQDAPTGWRNSYARTLQISIVGYFVGSMFLDLALFDLFYHLVVLAVCLDCLVPVVAAETLRTKEIEAREEWWREVPASAQ